jgi:peptide-methionine (S)-S-oxide reductase
MHGERLQMVLGVLMAALLASACGRDAAGMGSETHQPAIVGVSLDTATFGGGCFWCMEPPFDTLTGVHSVVSGYTGGFVRNPTYGQVSAGQTGHAEVVRIEFDPAVVSYERLLDIFWHNIDPLTANAQFCDQGSQYRSAIYYHGDRQRALAIASRDKLAPRFTRPIVTQIVPATTFYRAEEYHQGYHRKNPTRYKFYRWNCGRDRRLEELWGTAAGRGSFTNQER